MVRFRNHDGQTVKVAGDRDEAIARRIGDRIVMLVRAKRNADQPPAELKAWIDNMPKSLADRLGLVELELLDVRRREQNRPASELIDRWVEVVAARRNTTPEHAAPQGRLVRRLVGDLKINTFSQITPDDVLITVAGYKRSVSTNRHYLVAVKDFAKWMKKSKRATENPLADLPVPRMYEDPEIERVPLTVAEFQKLTAYLDTFIKYRRQVAGWAASDRKLLYWTAVKTAFRKSELASLRVSNLRLDAEPPCVEIKARNAKNRTAAAVPIPDDLAIALAEHVKGMDLTDKVFGFPSASGSVVTMLRRDLKGAGVAVNLGEREVRDFHTLRTTAITWWLVVDRVVPKEVQLLYSARLLMRHPGRASRRPVYPS